ncbi:MAG: hypothetical protein RLZZ350_835 [Verrucomicrobiota bacterium]|jgi:hypothetical protein
MKNSKLKNGGVRARVQRAFLIFNFAFLISAARASEQFGDVLVAPSAPLASGATQHGYAEARVLLENHSVTTAHRVTLTVPNMAWPYANMNSVRRITRTVTLAPGARQLVSLWQPPLPVSGDNQLRVEIDREKPESVALPNAGNHMNAGSRGSGATIPSTVLVSRNLNFDSVSRAFKNDGTGFTAAMATGAPDSSGRTGNPVITAWMPDPKQTGPSWLELEFNRPVLANEARLFQTLGVVQPGEMVLVGVSGTNLARIPLSSGVTPAPPPAGRGRGTGTGIRTSREFRFAYPIEPVKKVRLEFLSSPPNSINIDALKLSSAATHDDSYADSATASSDAAAEAGRFIPSVGAGNEQVLPLRAEFPITEWSDNWLTYSPYDVIVISAGEMKTLPGGIASALWSYASAGGNIFLVGGGEESVPEPWRSRGNHDFKSFTSFNLGFGRCFCAPTEDFSRLSSDSASLLRNCVGGTTRYWQSLPNDPDAANTLFPVVANTEIPVRGIVVIMLAFIIVIGPVNLLVLSRRNRRVWMLWTIPAISFVTCAVLLVYSLLREGVTPDARLRSLTLLDQENKLATSIGVEAFYCPLTPGGGLHFDYDTEVTPLLHVGYGSGTGNGRELDLTTGQHLARGWISARVPAHFHIRKNETRRERLQLDKTGGQLSIVNGLGGEIKTLWLADADGKLYSANNLPAGEKMKLLPSTAHPQLTSAQGPGNLLRDAGFTALAAPLTEPEKYLKPGCYLAELESNPFLENALGFAAKAKHTRASTVIYGVLENEGGAK